MIKKLIKNIPGVLWLYKLFNDRKPNIVDVESLNQQLQNIIINQYQNNAKQGQKLHNDISDAGFRCYSQFEEDGIILYVLTMIGMKTKKVVEICCGPGYECMAANLILNHGYRGYLFDGDERNISEAKFFFQSKQDCLLAMPSLKSAWITKDNINDLLRDIGATGEVDLLSLDIDGNDYYVWEAISEINPRLCVFETMNIIPGDLSLTIPYDPNFNCWSKVGPEQDFRSVSLLAMKKLSESKGYRMIGAHKLGFNVFFLRNDIGQEIFPEVSIEHVHNNIATKTAQKYRWPLVKNMHWKKV